MEHSRQTCSRSLAVAVGFLFASVAFSATPVRAQPASAEELCTPDVMRLCQEAIPERNKIVACLRAKRGQLSAGCRSVMTSKKRRGGRRS
jgi:hypothetical protein